MSKKTQNITPCISTSQMQMISMGSLSSLEMKQIYDHTAGCPFCEEVIDVLSPESISDILSVTNKVNARVAALAGPAPKVPFFRDTKFRMFVSTVAVIIGVWVISSLSSVSGEGKALNFSENKITVSLGLPESQLEGSKNKPDAGDQKQIGPPVLNPVEQNDVSTKRAENPNSVATQIHNQNTAKNQSSTLSPVNNQTTKRVTVSNIDLEVIGKNSLPEGASSGSRKNGQLTGGKSKGGNYKLEDMPEFRGGDEYLKTYLHDQIWKNISERDNLLGVTLTVFFDVSSRGKIENPEVIGKITDEQKEQIISVINNLPRFSPGRGKGSITYTMAISFN